MNTELDEAKTFPVLLVEDNRGDARLVQELLKETASTHFEVSHVERLAEARQQLMETGAGCVLLDLSLPDASRLEALMQKFASQEIARPWPPHPLFGRMDGRAWGYLSYRHFTHHLRQFGV